MTLLERVRAICRCPVHKVGLPAESCRECADHVALIEAVLAETRSPQVRVKPDRPPRYDEVFAAGQEWLDDE